MVNSLFSEPLNVTIIKQLHHTIYFLPLTFLNGPSDASLPASQVWIGLVSDVTLVDKLKAMINLYPCWKHFKKHKNISTFSITSPYWNGRDWPQEARTCLSHIINSILKPEYSAISIIRTMTADALVLCIIWWCKNQGISSHGSVNR